MTGEEPFNEGFSKSAAPFGDAEELRVQMEAESLELKNLILRQPPLDLLGYLWAQLHLALGFGGDGREQSYKSILLEFQFILEYVHAVWSSTRDLSITAQLDETKIAELFQQGAKLKATTMQYCMASSANSRREGQLHSSDTEFQAKSTWVLIRGNRFQVLEEEFFRFVLEPHDEALIKVYGVDSSYIAKEIQNIVDKMRMGFSDAFELIEQGMKHAEISKEDVQQSLHGVLAKLEGTADSHEANIKGALQDVLYAGICNISRHARLPRPLLEDLAYTPGENSEFFADGKFCGTPMRTLPARIKPAIRIGEEFYVTDGQFIRDAGYRAIQRGLLGRLPEYREEWNRRQCRMAETAYPTIFEKQLREATNFTEVYFRDVDTGEWVETDLVSITEDVLVVVEAKAGVQAMHSPATNFKSHERAISNLIVKAYEQCARFVKYLHSDAVVPVYAMRDGEYVEVARLQAAKFRKILPIGLTIEAFTPFSSMSKELPQIVPILDRYPFISMSVDDLFVLTRFLPTTGELLHYLEVRQSVAKIRRATIFDEIDHLGSYIVKNRFDMTLEEQLAQADMVAWDAFDEVVDEYFRGPDWQNNVIRRQDYPKELQKILTALDESRPVGWLAIDAFLRNLSSQGRNDLSHLIENLANSLFQFPQRRILYGSDWPLLVWVCRMGNEPREDAQRFQGQAAALVMQTQSVSVLLISYDRNLNIQRISCLTVQRPTAAQANFQLIAEEAEKQRKRTIRVGKDG